jgi:hypothetical protein
MVVNLIHEVTYSKVAQMTTWLLVFIRVKAVGLLLTLTNKIFSFTWQGKIEISNENDLLLTGNTKFCEQP